MHHDGARGHEAPEAFTEEHQPQARRVAAQPEAGIIEGAEQIGLAVEGEAQEALSDGVGGWAPGELCDGAHGSARGLHAGLRGWVMSTHPLASTE